MPLPTSGEISFQQFGTEFGDTGEIAMSNMYRGGAFVDATVNTPYSYIDVVPGSSIDGPYTIVGSYGWLWPGYPLDLGSNLAYFGGGIVSVSFSNGGVLTPFSFLYLGFKYYVDQFQGVVDGADRWYPISRQPTQVFSGVTVTQVNTGVPSSSTIGMLNMRGAQNY